MIRSDQSRVANRRIIDRAERAQRLGSLFRRAAVLSLRLIGFFLAVSAVGAGVLQIRSWLKESPHLVIRTIAIEGNDRATVSEIRHLIGIEEGENLFQADLGRARERLLLHPWIKDVRLSRSFPQGVRISVLERRPVALVHLDHTYLLDDSGEAFKRAQPGDPLDLPVITGLPRGEWAARSEESRRRLDEARLALEAYAARDRSRSLPVAEVHVDPVEGLTFYLGDRGFAVRLGLGDYPGKFDRLDRVLTEVERRGERLEMVRLDNRARPGWIAARLAKGLGIERRQAIP